jgi:hypothetical protein
MPVLCWTLTVFLDIFNINDVSEFVQYPSSLAQGLEEEFSNERFPSLIRTAVINIEKWNNKNCQCNYICSRQIRGTCEMSYTAVWIWIHLLKRTEKPRVTSDITAGLQVVNWTGPYWSRSTSTVKFVSTRVFDVFPDVLHISPSIVIVCFWLIVLCCYFHFNTI